MDLNKPIICPKCSSKNIYAGKEGFNTKKAVVGGLLTGNIFVMAAAGGWNANKIKLTCLDCGHEFNIGEGCTEEPSQAELNEFSKHVIPTSEKPKSHMFKCDCGKIFGADSEHPSCPKCGRRLNASKIATTEELNKYHKSGSGCLGVFLLFAVVITMCLYLI